jgi:hypothetical protein
LAKKEKKNFMRKEMTIMTREKEELLVEKDKKEEEIARNERRLIRSCGKRETNVRIPEILLKKIHN